MLFKDVFSGLPAEAVSLAKNVYDSIVASGHSDKPSAIKTAWAAVGRVFELVDEAWQKRVVATATSTAARWDDFPADLPKGLTDKYPERRLPVRETTYSPM